MPAVTSLNAGSSQTPTPTSTPPRPAHHHVPQQSSAHDLFRTLEAYPWDRDPSFLSGLEAILGSSSPTAATSAMNGDSTAQGHTGTVPDQRTTDLTLRARCFYYTRAYDQPIDFDAYAAWRSSQPPSSLAPLTTSIPQAATSDAAHETRTNLDVEHAIIIETEPENPDYPHSFAEIMHLIQTNQAIPGIRDIPDTVLEGQGTESQMRARPKPWEL